jgi:hypothetical protein
MSARLTRTTLYLVERDYRRLKSLARNHRRPAAELVREAVAEYVRRRVAARVPLSLGAGRSGRGDVSERADSLLSAVGRR